MPSQPDYWFRQTTAAPLFPDMLWSRPENRQYAGKLLVVGGNAHGFVAPAEAYRAAETAGIGTARMLLPDSMRQYVGKIFEAGSFAPTTPSGSFSQKALGELLPEAAWADGVLLAGDFGRNSETAILLEKFAAKYSGQLTSVGDAIDYFLATPAALLDRPETVLALTFSQLQKIAMGAHFDRAFVTSLDLLHFVELLHDFSSGHAAGLLVRHLDKTFVAIGGRIGSTAMDRTSDGSSLLEAAAFASVWWLQNPAKTFEALMTAQINH